MGAGNEMGAGDEGFAVRSYLEVQFAFQFLPEIHVDPIRGG